MDPIYQKLTTVFHDVFDDDTIVVTPELTAEEVPEWDSLAHIRLMLAVQKAFQTKLSASQMSHLKNVGDLAELIRSKTAA